jgi:ribulose-5-phosphate 4-epimerase/fuculose-1-phosphate aldolase
MGSASSSFRPTADRLAPELTEREQIVLLARALWHEGYDDHLAGHITVNQGDGTLLCNPWLLTWEEFGPDDVIRIDLDGNVLEGDWPAPLGIPLHLELHRARPGIGWALHHHSRWGTVWSDMKRVPPIHDQTGAGGGGQLVLVDEYDGNVGDSNAAAKAVEKMGDADLALLAHHGVFVLGINVNAVYWRAASLEWRCRNAWLVEQGGGGPGVPQVVHDTFGKSDGTRFTGYWETAVRRELRRDPELAARIGMASTTT